MNFYSSNFNIQTIFWETFKIIPQKNGLYKCRVRTILKDDRIADIFFYINNPLMSITNNANYIFDSDSAFKLNFSIGLEPKDGTFITIKLVQPETGVKNDY